MVEPIEFVATGEVLEPLCPLTLETPVDPVGLVADVRVVMGNVAPVVPRKFDRVS
jgi:hypothetical protein